MPNETKSQPRPSRPRTSHPQPHRRPTMYAVRGGMDDMSARCGASVSGTSEERGDASRRDATAAMARFLPHATDRVGDLHLPGGRSKRFIPGRPCFVSALAPSGSTPGARETVRHWHQSTSTTSISWPARRQAPPGHQEVAELVQKHQKLTGSGAPASSKCRPGSLVARPRGSQTRTWGAIQSVGWKRLPLNSEAGQRCCAFTPSLIAWTAFPGHDEWLETYDSTIRGPPREWTLACWPWPGATTAKGTRPCSVP